MAKSTRSKVKRTFRSKKRTQGVFAVADAARLQRLNAKLHALTTTAAPAEQQEKGEEGEKEQQDDVDLLDADGDGDVEVEMMSQPSPTSEDGGRTTSEKPTGKISTHGPRGSRRERWRASKGMTLRPKSRGLNKQGIISARRKPGRAHRRR